MRRLKQTSLVSCGISLFFTGVLADDDHEKWAQEQAEKSQGLVEKHKVEVNLLKDQAFKSQEKGLQCLTQQCLTEKTKLIDYSGASKNPLQKSSPALLVFVSFNMPKNSLKELAQSVQKIDGALIIRGLVDNSFIKTAEKV